MRDATFLLIINGSIGIFFALAFLGLSWRSGIRLGLWSAGAFLAAAATVTTEALAPSAVPPRVASIVSFSFLMLALTLIAAGLSRHYRPQANIWPLFLLGALGLAFHVGVTSRLPRGEMFFGLAYQSPFALMMVVATGSVLRSERRGAVDRLLAVVLVLIAAQFLMKGGAGFIVEDKAPDVRDYLFSVYARYSQTFAAILSLMLGLALLGVLIAEVVANATLSLQRDTLSGLLNRAAFMQRATASLRALPAGATASLVMIDLDYFKSINDRFGHAAGDEAIRAFGAILMEAATGAEIAGRIGGEEFCLLMPGADAGRVRARIQKLQSTFRARRYRFIPHETRVTASFGAALMRPGESLDEALRRADKALYTAKAMGRDRFVMADTPGTPSVPPA
ncbi:GGDEF domain-containing protein [Ancylobacter sp. A5.8]|uniref:GGDEF domain-containing protein n=1 Tax=Ancylobacter gelatini TaxID=2919920 RepID=UPI001F4D5B9E|nr:GGDEF domain-containing protein [Ancylobacter gelatini]MCJ8142473.1 GGDEF domain-containing protein [Ancylobacter gelatini]